MSNVFIVSGYSGAGKSTVLRILEDRGFFCIDNLPIDLLVHFFAQLKNVDKKIALGIDIRAGKADILMEKINQVRFAYKKEIQIFFLTATPAVLLKRFQETRRTHPLGTNMPLEEAIAHEIYLLHPLVDVADCVLQTDQLTIHQLKQIVQNLFLQDKEKQLIVHLISFGFKYGLPVNCNFIYDLRSLPNPHAIPSLRSLTGIEQPVKEYLFALAVVQDYWQKLREFILYSLERTHQDGRYFITIAFGCTGGRHRSVAFVEALASLVVEQVIFMVKHRDIDQNFF